MAQEQKASRAAACQHYQRQGRHVFVVCNGETCQHAGARRLLDLLRLECHKQSTEHDVRVSASRECIGHCAAAPAMVEDGRVLHWVTERRLRGELLRLGIGS